ncbi:TPA: hypothetical protein PXJ37_002725 [Yersinia enterocolitica]|nr:hypothetical protein [Yersinia enterocolitica]HDL6613135.1 hypothetical protein [Yersinia enterocolitica]HDM8322195.1 hypothetical protein [Yersinia enterocolitica]HEF7274772.1 hypothetical protein [Yersinia enterocolitica]HEK5864372.1 hypothetical protein [Yersinia enterocolitica]
MYNLRVDVRKASEQVVSKALQDIGIVCFIETLENGQVRLFNNDCSIPEGHIQELLTNLSGVGSFVRLSITNKEPTPYHAFIEC